MATRALAIRELLRQEADRLAIEAEPLEDDDGRRETDEEARLRALLEREVRVPCADKPACRRYYESNRQRFRSPDLVEAAHILIAAAPDDRVMRESARQTATVLIAELQSRPDRFTALASTHSACPSGKQGGNLGQIGPGQTVGEFEAALASMAVGLHPEPVESRYGVHVVRLDRRIEGRQLPFVLVRERIADYLDDTVHHRALQQYVSILAGRAELTGVDLSAGRGPLVQ
jgi:peptidyl-prolyl cis-trans isomerase C